MLRFLIIQLFMEEIIQMALTWQGKISGKDSYFNRDMLLRNLLQHQGLKFWKEEIFSNRYSEFDKINTSMLSLHNLWKN